MPDTASLCPKNIPALTTPCSECPWRKSNQGKPHPLGYYKQTNLRRLWTGLRTGEAPGMTCHPTDRDNPIPEGAKPVGENVIRHECAGSLILIIRELRLLEKLGKEGKTVKEYFKLRGRKGLSTEGIQWWLMARVKFANVPFGGPSIPNLVDDPDVYYKPLAMETKP